MCALGTSPVHPVITWESSHSSSGGRWFFGGFVRQNEERVLALRRQAEVTFFFCISGIEFVVDGPMNRVKELDECVLDVRDQGLELIYISSA
jgi:hypothetical protein